jgi:hypothetical protein
LVACTVVPAYSIVDTRGIEINATSVPRAVVPANRIVGTRRIEIDAII